MSQYKDLSWLIPLNSDQSNINKYSQEVRYTTLSNGGGIWHQHLDAQIKTNFSTGASLRTRELQKGVQKTYKKFLSVES